MKVRRKVNPYREWIVKEESTSFYISYDGDSDPMALPKADYEPVQEWMDVTQECSWSEHECSATIDAWKDEWYIKHGSKRVEGFAKEYRVRKVTLREGQGPVEAFIVERRKR